MTQAGKAVIDQQEGTEAGASGVTQALRSLCRPSAKSTLIHHQQADGGMACGHRAPSGGRLRRRVLLYWYILADANGGLCIGRSHADHRGLGAFSHQRAAQSIYPCIACYYYQCPKEIDIVRICGILANVSSINYHFQKLNKSGFDRTQ